MHFLRLSEFRGKEGDFDELVMNKVSANIDETDAFKLTVARAIINDPDVLVVDASAAPRGFWLLACLDALCAWQAGELDGGALPGTAVLRAELATVAKFCKCWRARSRLYRSQSLQVNTHWKAFFEIYKIHTPSHRSELEKSI